MPPLEHMDTLSPERVRDLLSAAPRGESLDALLDDPLIRAAREARDRVFGRAIRLFAPLYYSNVCANDCIYCGFRRSLGTARRRILTPAEVVEETAALLRQGHRRILLIASEDPTRKGLDLALEAVEAVRLAARIVPAERPGANGSEHTEAASSHDAGSLPNGPSSNGGRPCIFSQELAVSLSMEMAPRSSEDFAALAQAGVSGYVLFQETYDRALYPKIHPAGPKADYENRIAGPERAARAGIRNIGLGVLYGLADPVEDTIALIDHARRIEEATGRPVASVSVPRLEPAEGVPFTVHPPHPVPNALWFRIMAVLRLALPRTDLLISTREPVALRRAALEAGATVFSAGSRTDPGGYTDPGSSRGQFEVGDERPLAEVADDLRRLGYRPE